MGRQITRLQEKTWEVEQMELATEMDRRMGSGRVLYVQQAGNALFTFNSGAVYTAVLGHCSIDWIICYYCFGICAFCFRAHAECKEWVGSNI
jgi:hypothetical protein